MAPADSEEFRAPLFGVSIRFRVRRREVFSHIPATMGISHQVGVGVGVTM
jgi:hypothetical protein